MKLKHLLLSGLLLLAGASYAQEPGKVPTLIPRLYHQNYFLLNPAYAGSRGSKEFGITGNLNSLNDPSSAPRSVSAYYQGVVSDTTQSGVGITMMYNHFGPYWLGKLGLAYTKRFRLGDYSSLGIGAELSAKYLNVDLAQYSTTYGGKAMVGNDNDLRPDVNAGIWLNVRNFFAGATFANLLEPSFALVEKTELNTERELYLTAGYNLRIANGVRLVPSVFMQRTFKGGEPEFQFNALAHVKFLSVGATYRGQFDDRAPWNINAGLNITNKLQLLTSYDLTNSGTETANSLTQPDPQVEASLRIKF